MLTRKTKMLLGGGAAISLAAIVAAGYVWSTSCQTQAPSRLWSASIARVPERQLEAKIIAALHNAKCLTVRRRSIRVESRAYRSRAYRTSTRSAIDELAATFSIVPDSKRAVLYGTTDQIIVAIDGVDELIITADRLYFPAPTPNGMSVKLGLRFLSFVEDRVGDHD